MTDHRPTRLIEHRGSDRREAELFIGDRYARTFGASIRAYMPRLFTLRESDGRICGAFGLRAAHHRLFSERYLDAPVEQHIERCTGNRVERRAIVEVGHLCGANAGAMRYLIELLAPALKCEGFSWVVFTSTAALRNAFRRVGLQPLDLGPARIECLSPEERQYWGRYYEHAPRVSAGEIALGVRAFVHLPKKSEVVA